MTENERAELNANFKDIGTKLDTVIQRVCEVDTKCAVIASEQVNVKTRLDAHDKRLDDDQKWKLYHPVISAVISAVSHPVAHLVSGSRTVAAIVASWWNG